jgi:hypothetical protein
MSTISVDTLEDRSATESVDATYIVHGTTKSFWNYNQNTGPTINESLNISSITDDAAGQHTINYTTSFNAATHAVVPGGVTNTGATTANHFAAYGDNAGARTAGTSGRLYTRQVDAATIEDTLSCGVSMGALA